uniref:Tc1-like transposase DDE domain-containing protein n=1 Tax=Acanthochromis polyacanthus TaxID=80966 RepID=A0A3Q1FT46_9TELE
MKTEQGTFQHDNNPKRLAKKTKEWLSKKKFKVLEWPPQSPDLNSIENLWELLNQYQDKSTHIRNEEDLWKDCQSTWSKITGDMCSKLEQGY